jgi:hypothetical protein
MSRVPDPLNLQGISPRYQFEQEHQITYLAALSPPRVPENPCCPWPLLKPHDRRRYVYRDQPLRRKFVDIWLKRGMLARSVHDAAWSTLVQFVQYKAASAGAEIVLVDPRGTSQTCPDCGTIKPKKLSERIHCCDCGCVMDRDVAAAKIVHQRAFGLGPGYDPQSPSQRVAA